MPARAVFWNLFARRYSRQKIGDEAAYQIKLEKTRTYFTPESTVLEFGCGTGSTAILHAPHVAHITAIDFSRGMITVAEERKTEAGMDNVEFRVMRIEDMPDTTQYDVVLGMNILHLLDNWQDVIGQVHGLLRPEGVFISSTACLRGMPLFLRLLIPVFRLIGVTAAVFSTREFKSALESAGFVIEDTWKPKPASAIFIAARKAG